MKARYAIVKTYWRDNKNPFPGRLTETRIVCQRENGRRKESWQMVSDTVCQFYEEFEALVDAAQEGR